MSLHEGTTPKSVYKLETGILCYLRTFKTQTSPYLFLGPFCTGIGYQNESLSAAVIFDPLTDRYVDAYFSRVISPELQVGAILSHQIDQGFGSAKVGGSYHWDKQSTVKWRIDSHGMAAGLLQYTPNTRITFGLLTDINLKDLGAKPQIGLSMSLKA